MQTPELLLTNLNNALRELYGAAKLIEDDRLGEALPLVMRKLLLAQILGDKTILAIGGSQGAGKTTFLRSLYEFDADDSKWLSPNIGTGEIVPVLVIEHASHTSVRGALMRLVLENDNYVLVTDEDISIEQFQTAITTKVPGVLLPVLMVPQRYFTRPNQAWLLLPGYEPEDRDNKPWQELMRQALIGAAGCVIVTDETRMANQQQVQIVKDMLQNELRSARPLVVISKTEAAWQNPARLDELRKTASEVYGLLAETAAQSIICAGSDNRQYMDVWLPQMQEAIAELARAGGADRKVQLRHLDTVLSRDLTAVLSLITTKSRLHFHQREGGDSGPLEVVEACLLAFDDAAEELREQYQDEVSTLLGAHFGPAWIELQERLKTDHEGLWNGVKGFFQTSTQSQQAILADIQGAWGKSSDFLAKFGLSLGKLTGRLLGAPESAKMAVANAPSSVSQQLGYVDANCEPIRWTRPDDKDVQNLRLLMAGNQFSDDGHAPRATKELERSVKLLPALALEYMRIGATLPGLVGVDPNAENPIVESARADMMKQAAQQLGDSVNLGQTVLRSLATILTVDVLSDGDTDVVGALLNVFKGDATSAADGSVTDASGAIVGIGAAVVGVVAVGYLAYSAVRATRAHDDRGRVMAHAMLMSLKEQHFSHFMSHYKQLMGQLRARLRQSLRERYRLNETLLEKDRLSVSLGQVRSLQRDLLDHIGRSGQTLSIFEPETPL
ncbi:MAG: hypothetical protein V4723_07365 [Pseudomonadota bacterium]